MALKLPTRPTYPYTYRKVLPWSFLVILINAFVLWATLVSSGRVSVSANPLASLAFLVPFAAGWVLLASFILGIAGLVSMFVKEARPIGLALVLQACILLPVIQQSMQIRWSIQRNAYESLAERSVALIEAIDRFYTHRGGAPDTLEALVPEYLEAVPGTGMAAHPEFAFHPQSQRSSFVPEFDDEPWVLMVHTWDFLSFDRFVYVPSENYPERGESGWYERIGDWAYYHE